MYAIIIDGGRQLKVEPGQEVVVDYQDVPQGNTVTFNQVLAVNNNGALTIGSPTVSGAKVTAEVLGPLQGDKIYIQKLRRRKNYRRRTGHRQIHTRVKISEISAG
jgi:large subunit ribosomal protein L21